MGAGVVVKTTAEPECPTEIHGGPDHDHVCELFPRSIQNFMLLRKASPSVVCRAKAAVRSNCRSHIAKSSSKLRALHECLSNVMSSSCISLAYNLCGCIWTVCQIQSALKRERADGDGIGITLLPSFSLGCFRPDPTVSAPNR